jgi:glycosyl transferase, family 25
MILIILIILIYLFIKYYLKKEIPNQPKSNLPIIYVINLKRSKDRLNHIQNEFYNNKITNFERFNAVDGLKHKLNKQELHIFRNYKLKDKQFGVVCCALSHFYLWKKIIDNNIQECIITEDDISLKNNFSTNLDKLLKIKDDYSLIFLYNTNKLFLRNNNTIIHYNKLKWYGCGAVMYYITNKAARHLYQKVINHGIHRAIDWFIYEEINKIKIGISKIPLITTGKFKSIRVQNNLNNL